MSAGAGDLPGSRDVLRREASHFGERRAPHLLEMIEIAHVRTEEVHQHVARVDQHPVADPQPLDRGTAVPVVLDRGA